MKSILQSIKPQYCELIASGKKTIEVRKTKPKLKTPFKVYIYCTQDFYRAGDGYFQGKYCGKVIGEFVCDKIIDIDYGIEEGVYFDSEYQEGFETNGNGNNPTCLSFTDLENYLMENEGYGWHISDLKIYDKPKDLNEFYVVDNEAVKQCEYRNKCYINPYLTNGGWLNGTYSCSYNGEHEFCTKCKVKPLTRPPQSWCYIEEV